MCIQPVGHCVSPLSWKKNAPQFFVSTFDFSWDGNQWCFCKQQEDKTTTKSHPFVLTRVSTRGSQAACVMGGIKEEEREGKKTPNKKEKGWRRKKTWNCRAGRRDHVDVCGWSNQALIRPQGTLEAFTQKHFSAFCNFARIGNLYFE